jgi:S1-C subfamily serine protease
METKLSEVGSTLAALSNDLAEAVESVGRSVVAVNARPRTPSSGVLWRSGIVVTAAHTVRRHEEITVTVPGGSTVPAALAGRDPATDLAVLKIQETGSASAEVGDASSLKVGHLVLAVGRAESGQVGPTASLGVISALGGPWQTWGGGRIDQFLRLDVTVFLGFSGGPLVDPRGRVVGINTTGLWRNAGLGIPASTVNRVLKELLEKGHVPRGFLGLGMQTVRLPGALKSKLNLPGDSGMIVFTVEPDGPADKAGAVIGDVLVALDGKAMSDIGDVQATLGSESVGKTIRASVVRGGEKINLDITIGARPLRED